MSTTSCNPDGAYLPAAGVPGRQSLTNAESEADNFLGSQRRSRSSLRGGSYGCGHSEVSDDDLIARARCGDQQAFVELCGRHSSMVKNKILKIVRNHEDAEDALQDTLMRAYVHLVSFRGSCKFSTWLTTIGVNSALMIMRKRRIRRETIMTTSSEDTRTVELQEPVDQSLSPEGSYLEQEATLLVRKEVEKLKPRLRSAVIHFYGSEYSLEESAKALDISPNAVKSRLSRGRARLRSTLAKYAIPEPRK